MPRFRDAGVAGGLRGTRARASTSRMAHALDAPVNTCCGCSAHARGCRPGCSCGPGGEEPVCHVDGDAALFVRPQPVGQRREIGDAVVVGDGVEMIQRQAVRCRAAGDRSACSFRRPPNPRWRCAIVGVSSEVPSRLRSSIAATEVRSSARVSPRSDTVAAEISAITPAMSGLHDRTAPVMVRSPPCGSAPTPPLIRTLRHNVFRTPPAGMPSRSEHLRSCEVDRRQLGASSSMWRQMSSSVQFGTAGEHRHLFPADPAAGQ